MDSIQESSAAATRPPEHARLPDDGRSRDTALGGDNDGASARATGVGVLDRCVGLLDLLADGPKSLRLLSDRSGLPRPTAHRLLVALEAHRLAARDDSGLFRLGPRLVELATKAGPELNLAVAAGPVLARLHAKTGESVQLYVRSGVHRLCVAARDSGTGLRDSVPVGALLPLAAGSGGKVLLAWSADGDRLGVPASELAEVREQRFAESVAEREPGVASVSAPVFAGSENRGETLIAALCVSGPVSRLGQAPGRTLSAAVVAAAAELSALLA
ncbi:MAG TPA: IclR family transcriptional regulator [Streptosporangiaceae bacterium]